MKPLHYLMFFFAAQALNAQNLTMMLSPSQVSGNQITYDVRAQNFTDMVAMQYGIVYDPQLLTFVSLQNMSLTELDAGDFNPNIPGSIRNVWLEPALTGITLSDGALLYQIVFEMQGTEPGNVCFSEDALQIEFVTIDQDLAAFTVVDDCYPEPHVIELISSVDDLAAEYGVQIATVGDVRGLAFRVHQPQRIGFTLIDFSGKVIHIVEPENWPAGPHGIYFRQPLIPGMYVLQVLIGGEQYGVKVAVTE